MDRKKILERLAPIFQDIFDDENIFPTDETTANDIEDWDSFAQIRLTAAIEGEFKIKFDFGELNKLKNVGEIVDAIIRKSGR